MSKEKIALPASSQSSLSFFHGAGVSYPWYLEAICE
jgi:hypothetical protein